MKKKIVLFGVLTAALAIGTITFGTLNNKREATALNAEA